MGTGKSCTFDMLKLSKDIKDKMIKAEFGMERECIRVDENCMLSQKPHPTCFGDKLTKKHITTDFSESQVEMITPALDNIDDMYDYAAMLYDYVCANIDEEYLWCQSMPCVIGDNIPVALYEGEVGRQATEYREMLVERYGGERQLISGVHFNFSFTDDFLHALYEEYGKGQEYRLFADEVYLKVTRNYIRYGFLIAYLCGCSNICHSTYDKKCIETLQKREDDSFTIGKGVSLRNSKWGYRNREDLFPDYRSAKDYVDSINVLIDTGKISYAKEYYSTIRLKSVDHELETLAKEGIKYIELRTIDINPFEKVGVNIWDLKFIHVFMILMLIMEEQEIESYQKDGLDAKEDIALYGLDSKIRLNKKEYSAKDICIELIEKTRELNRELDLYEDEIMQFQLDKINKGGYAHRNSEMEYLKGSMELMKHYKVAAKLGASALSEKQIAEITE